MLKMDKHLFYQTYLFFLQQVHYRYVYTVYFATKYLVDFTELYIALPTIFAGAQANVPPLS